MGGGALLQIRVLVHLNGVDLIAVFLSATKDILCLFHFKQSKNISIFLGIGCNTNRVILIPGVMKVMDLIVNNTIGLLPQ